MLLRTQALNHVLVVLRPRSICNIPHSHPDNLPGMPILSPQSSIAEALGSGSCPSQSTMDLGKREANEGLDVSATTGFPIFK